MIIYEQLSVSFDLKRAFLLMLTNLAGRQINVLLNSFQLLIICFHLLIIIQYYLFKTPKGPLVIILRGECCFYQIVILLFILNSK